LVIVGSKKIVANLNTRKMAHYTENVNIQGGPALTRETEKPGQRQAVIRVLLAEDHNIVRNGILSLLEKELGIEVVAEASDGHEATRKIEQNKFIDVVLADMNMPGMNGIELVSTLKLSHPQVKVLILSMLDHENYVIQAMSAGAYGYLLKKVSREELVFAIRQVAGGGKYICMDLTARIVSKLTNAGQEQPELQARQVHVNLSKREVEVLGLIAEGLTNSEIANKLFTSRRTVEGHRKKLIDKTGARNTAALIRFAVTNGLLK
jgi:DNA-binding NarL/FixJ family response regulator